MQEQGETGDIYFSDAPKFVEMIANCTVMQSLFTVLINLAQIYLYTHALSPTHTVATVSSLSQLLELKWKSL